MLINNPMNILRKFKDLKISSELVSPNPVVLKVTLDATSETKHTSVSAIASSGTIEEAENLALIKAIVRLHELTTDESILKKTNIKSLGNNILGITDNKKMINFIKNYSPEIAARYPSALTLDDIGIIEIAMAIESNKIGNINEDK